MKYRIECKSEKLIQTGSEQLAEDCADSMARRNYGETVRVWDSVQDSWRLLHEYIAAFTQ